MVERSGRVREWIRRYLAAELTGIAGAAGAALIALAWWPQQLALVAVAASLGETVGFYVGFLATRWITDPPAGPKHRRLAVLLATCVVEFGPAEIADTVLLRPLAMILGSLGTGNAIIGILAGKLVADVVFYALAITSYEVAVRRLLTRLRRPAGVADDRESATRAS